MAHVLALYKQSILYLQILLALWLSSTATTGCGNTLIHGISSP